MYVDLTYGGFQKPSEVIDQDIEQKMISNAKGVMNFYSKSHAIKALDLLETNPAFADKVKQELEAWYPDSKNAVR